MHPDSGKNIDLFSNLSLKTFKLFDFAPIWTFVNSSICKNAFSKSGGALTSFALSMMFYRISEEDPLLVMGNCGDCS